MSALIVVFLLLAIALWCDAYGCAILLVTALIIAALPGRALSHEQQSLRQWHRRNR